MAGYFRNPTLAQGTIVFVSEDDLWSVSSAGGVARRLTSGLGRIEAPCLSPDAKWIAYTSTDEGQTEIYLMNAEGGPARRLTYYGSSAFTVGWTPQNEVVFSSDYGQPFAKLYQLFSASLEENSKITKLNLGPALSISYGPLGAKVLARNSGTRTGSELAYWKRYRGGTAGEMWVDLKGDNAFKKIVGLDGNTARPTWLGERIYFISDHEGIGNIYSIKASGGDLKQHSDSTDFYVRGLSTDGESLVYYAGGDIFTLKPGVNEVPHRVEIETHSPRMQTNRKFISAAQNLEDYDLDPKGERLVISSRARILSFDAWKGAIAQQGDDGSQRYRLGRFLNDGERVVLVSDEGGEESFEIHDVASRSQVRKLATKGLGRTLDMKISPVADEALLTNHRNEIIWLSLITGEAKILDRSAFTRIYGFNWSPDGRYAAYSRAESARLCGLHIYDLKMGEGHRVTRPILQDVNPVFDPLGEFLYFISYREFDPVYDNVHFDLGFPRGSKPFLLMLKKRSVSPFSADYKNEKRTRGPRRPEQLEMQIDFGGIEDRIVAFPCSDGRYGAIGASSDKVYFMRYPIEGALGQQQRRAQRGFLEFYDFKDEKVETLANDVSSFKLSLDCGHLIYRAGSDLRVLKAGERPNKDEDTSRKSGWVDLDRVQIAVHPHEEWRQMFHEAWRLQRDHFWKEDMATIDWQKVLGRYAPLLDRIAVRGELSDVLWEMQGELGTSHAYEFGGDYRKRPAYYRGFLGAEWEFDAKENGYRLTEIIKGDVWDEDASSPLARAGIELSVGDYLLGVDGQDLSRELRPEQILIHRAGRDVALKFRRQNETDAHTRTVHTLRSELSARYRDWVERNRKWVHQASKGRIGYVHIPDMSAAGYAEFHRSFLSELDREGLIIDVRFNGGGHVSQLVLEKLSRRRIGYCQTRWFGVQPYPTEAPQGPMAALTNEYAGSDGDIFSHSFKLLKLGPLIGKRTWGGVIGINPSHPLSDGSVTTQPEYSFWFEDVGWRVENYGTEPDIEVEIPPAAYAQGLDPQLERAVLAVFELMSDKIERSEPPLKPVDITPLDLSLPDLDLK